MHAVTQHEAPTASGMSRDIEIAMALAVHAPAGEAAARVRQRLHGYIELLAGPAESQVQQMAPSRGRDVAEGTVRHARGLTRPGPGGDPAATLRLLAKSTQHLMRYTADVNPAQPQAGTGPGEERPPGRLYLVPLREESGTRHPNGRGQSVRAVRKEEESMEQSKSEHALRSGPVVVDAPGGVASIVAPSGVVRIEDVEDEGP
ncbi:DUF6415 family natural product biosynthesis protein [Streptomyces melanogenes]|uniref:DUF6415 family natural product biosynthesis protein n=1 Tax=Streptomyces melanogenes TaxID=67326 RepID=UPI0037969E12